MESASDDRQSRHILFRDLDDIVSNGAAADAAQADTEICKLPRVMRLALLALRTTDASDRIAADIVDLAPDLHSAAAIWAEQDGQATWRDLAAKLDETAAQSDSPALRGVADAVRVVTMTRKDVENSRVDALRVLASLELAEDEARRKNAPIRYLAFGETLRIGWVLLMNGRHEKRRYVGMSALHEALTLGKNAVQSVREAVRAELEEAEAEREKLRRDAEKKSADRRDEVDPAPAVTDGYIRVCPPIEAKNGNAKDAVRGHEHVIGIAVPLAPMPDIAKLRAHLAFEFPYADEQISRILAPLVGRAYVHFPPTLLVGPPGAGKSRFCRRLAETLGIGVWRTDGARADGNTFGGTDRRWYTSEPSHPFMAISRARHANPLVIVDEIDKAATRSDYGRLWDAMLAFLEPETAAHYPDPALQVDIDLSQVSFMATANSLMPLPSALVDRFRVVEMPEPRVSDLQSLVPPLIADLAREQDLDQRWFEPLTQDELNLLGSRWHGGSVRRLRAYLEVLLRAKDRCRLIN